MSHTVGLVGEAVGWAESLSRAYGAGPFAGVNIWVQGTISLKAILFGSKTQKGVLSLCFINMYPYTCMFLFTETKI